MSRPDPDTESKVRTTVRSINDTIQNNANEPSVALYRVQEHVHKTVPIMVQKRYELENLQEQLKGLVFDIEYSIDSVKELGTSEEHVNNIITYLHKVLATSKQINDFRQKQIEQQLFAKKEGPIIQSLKN